MKARVTAAALLLVTAAVCFGAAEARVSRRAITAVEGAINDKFRTVTPDPYDLLGTARGTYLDGYGALFTVELQLVYLPPLTPFRPAFTPAELTTMRDREMKKVPFMKEAMRSLIAGAGSTLETLPSNERISLEAILWHYSWEDSRGLPQRILMSVEKDKLLQAEADHADLATVIEEREQ